MLLLVDDEPHPMGWLVEKTVTVVSVTVNRKAVEIVGLTPDHSTVGREFVRVAVPFGSPLGNSILAGWGKGPSPSETGKNITFARTNGQILAK